MLAVAGVTEIAVIVFGVVILTDPPHPAIKAMSGSRRNETIREGTGRLLHFLHIDTEHHGDSKLVTRKFGYPEKMIAVIELF
jgi:hypothetical protein